MIGKRPLQVLNCCKKSIGRVNIHSTHVTANNSTNNNVFFFVSDLKIVFYNNIYSPITKPWTREENTLCHNLFGNEIIQNCLKIDSIW